MNRLAAGDFTVRLQPAAHGYEPTEIREFKAAFNKAAEELSGTELLRKDFVNNFSHEFKTPIVSISGFADLLLDEDVTPEEQREYLQIIRDESRRAGHSFPAVCCFESYRGTDHSDRLYRLFAG